MAELREIVSRPSAHFSADLAAWLSPPHRPDSPVSERFRTGLRNSIAFGVVWMIVFTVATFALTGSLPAWPYVTVALAVALYVAMRSWRTESILAQKDNDLMLEAHGERYRAYLHRRQVWSRLRYCPRCAIVFDLATLQSASLFDIHELANSRISDVSFR